MLQGEARGYCTVIYLFVCCLLFTISSKYHNTSIVLLTARKTGEFDEKFINRRLKVRMKGYN